MKKKLCLLVALILSFSVASCQRLNARVKLREANDLYVQERYAEALKTYVAVRKIDPSFPDVDRLIGYCNIALYKPEDTTPANEKYADTAILELQTYLKKRPNDEVTREALINLFLNANRTSQAIDYFRNYLKDHPADLNAVKSIATLYAKQGNFNEALNWYQKITLLDGQNPEAFYTYGVVLYEKVAKNPPEDMNERLAYIEKGKGALQRASELRADYFEAVVYMNLLFREQAKVELDPIKQQELIAQAETWRNKAVAINKARKKT